MLVHDLQVIPKSYVIVKVISDITQLIEEKDREVKEEKWRKKKNGIDGNK